MQEPRTLLRLRRHHRPLHLRGLLLRPRKRPRRDRSQDAVLRRRDFLLVLCDGLVSADCELAGGIGVWGFIACGGSEWGAEVDWEEAGV